MSAEHVGNIENNIFSLFWAYYDVIMYQIGKFGQILEIMKYILYLIENSKLLGAEPDGDIENNIFSLFWAYYDVIMYQISKYWNYEIHIVFKN